MDGTRRANNEGSKWQGKDGRWYGEISLGGGKRKRYSAKTARERDRRMREGMLRLAQGELSTSKTETLGQYLTAWLEGKRKLKEYSRWVYRSRVAHIRRTIGAVRLDRLEAAHINSCYRTLESENLKPRTVHGVHVVLKGALTQAVKERKILRNPMDTVEAPHFDPPERETLSMAQVEQLLEHTRADRLHALWFLLAMTGMRIGETLALHWRDVDLDGARVSVKYTLHQKPGGGMELTTPKTAKSRGLVYLDADVVAALRAHRERQQFERRSPLWSEMDLVFCKEDGTPLHNATCGRMLKRTLAELGLPALSPHGLRHSCATIGLYELEMPAGLVQETLRHANIRTTIGMYGHVTPEMQQEAAKRMGDLLRKKQKA